VSRCRAPPLIDFTSLFQRIYESVYKMEHDERLSAEDAIRKACLQRFRPIL
jgi:hypothetical protein